MRRRKRAGHVFIAAIALIACSGDDTLPVNARPGPPPIEDVDEVGTTARMDFADGDFWATPLPSEHRRAADGSIDVSGFPDPTQSKIVEDVKEMIATDARGFGATSGIFFPMTGPLDPTSLPDLGASTKLGATVFLVALDDGAPDVGQRYPVYVDFRADGGPFGAPNLLTLLPLQGIPLRPSETYAAVVLRDVKDASGKKLVGSRSLARLLRGARPDGMSDAAFSSYGKAIQRLKTLGVDPARIAALTVFVTDDPTASLDAVRRDAIASPPKPDAPFSRGEVFDDYCVYGTTIGMPDYQAGTPPFAQEGGAWAFDASGAPILQRTETARVFVTVPRRPMPANGFPMVVFSRTGGGGDRPLVDRGTQAESGGPPITPGTGPAMFFARAGFAGASIDGPHGGIRNVTGMDEQFLVFNVANPVALRDNVRQSAIELALATHVLDSVEIDAHDCPGVTTPDGGPVRFDAGKMALMGHSMGATIAPLAAAFEPRFRALVLSGAGGSWIENVVHKLKPLPVKGAMELLLGIAGTYELHEHDPLLSLFQWAGEPADPPLYGRFLVHEPPEGALPRHVLMEQGIVDHYILPAIANATSLSVGLDLLGPSLDASTPELADYTPLRDLLAYSGRRTMTAPASGNEAVGSMMVTAVIAQHPSDGIEDGHEIVFQTDAPKHQYECFLASLASGVPRVPPDGAINDPCTP